MLQKLIAFIKQIGFTSKGEFGWERENSVKLYHTNPEKFGLTSFSLTIKKDRNLYMLEKNECISNTFVKNQIYKSTKGKEIMEIIKKFS